MSEQVKESMSIKRLEQVADLLQSLHETVLENGDGLDRKAWNVLSVGSSTFAIVAVLQALLAKEGGVSSLFWGGLFVVIGLYLRMAWYALRATSPADYVFVPGRPRADLPFTEWRAAYIETGDEQFLVQRLIDLAGNEQLPGAIARNEAVNENKAQLLTEAIRSLIATVIGLVVLAFIAAVV